MSRFMAAALSLGRRNLGLTAPNPSVGALIVRDGVVIAGGVTAPGGRPHAETLRARGRGRGGARRDGLCDAGAVLASRPDAALRGGACQPRASARVVCALQDPDPRVAGRGLALLRDGGDRGRGRGRRRGGAARPSRPYPARDRRAADGHAEAGAHGGRLSPPATSTIPGSPLPARSPTAGCRRCGRRMRRSWSASAPRSATIRC